MIVSLFSIKNIKKPPSYFTEHRKNRTIYTPQVFTSELKEQYMKHLLEKEW